MIIGTCLNSLEMDVHDTLMSEEARSVPDIVILKISWTGQNRDFNGP